MLEQYALSLDLYQQFRRPGYARTNGTLSASNVVSALVVFCVRVQRGLAAVCCGSGTLASSAPFDLTLRPHNFLRHGAGDDHARGSVRRRPLGGFPRLPRLPESVRGHRLTHPLQRRRGRQQQQW